MEGERQKLITKWLLRYIRNQTEMFTNDSVETYSKLLCYVAGADGVFASAEREWIIGYRQQVVNILKFLFEILKSS
jgi:hypothetical protein